ncbi:META domain-containing protein [Kribbella sp. NBC_01245]|uniref:META domain-containing protein n=1 Tax=Kribbella sp. NBC_01245 TaxID=2903578 RepID=UPI002E2DACA7|nr:META domain-containing protein [Kribbella sp. NBC_01245]
MSKTELEQDLRKTFERAAASVPAAPDLVIRAETQVRRERKTWAAAGAAVVAVAAVAVVGVAMQREPDGPPVAGQPAAVQTSSATTTASATAPATVSGVSGTWFPLRMTGFTGLRKARPQQPMLTFAADGTWTGSDGCNSLGGTYTIGAGGQFSATVGDQRLAGCDNVPHTGVLMETRKVVGDKISLRFLGADGLELASYVRTR